MNKFELIIFAGAPGSGKTTIGEMLRDILKCPYIDFGDLRTFHLDREWKNASKAEEKIAFENLVFILKNYIQHGYKNIIITDLQDFRVNDLSKIFHKNKYIIISLILNEDEELKKRVLGARDSGFRDYKKALKWNENLIQRELLPCEYRIDSTHDTPKQTLNKILALLKTK